MIHSHEITDAELDGVSGGMDMPPGSPAPYTPSPAPTPGPTPPTGPVKADKLPTKGPFSL